MRKLREKEKRTKMLRMLELLVMLPWLGCLLLALLPLLRSAVWTYRQNQGHRERLEGELRNDKDMHKDYWRACWYTDAMFAATRSLLRHTRGYLRLIPQMLYKYRKDIRRREGKCAQYRRPWLKPLVLAAAIGILSAVSAHASWTYVAYAKNANTGSDTTLVGDVTLNLQAGDTLIIIVGWYGGDLTMSVSDGGSNTLTMQTATAFGSDTLWRSQWGYLLAATANATATITATWGTASTYRSFQVLQFRPSATPTVDAISLGATANSSNVGSNYIWSDGQDTLVLGGYGIASSRSDTNPLIGGVVADSEPYASSYYTHMWYKVLSDVGNNYRAQVTASSGNYYCAGILALSIGDKIVERYVRAGAGGTATGGSWTNALTDLPAVLSRDRTWYVADGTYATYTIDDAVDGTKVLMIKKAVAADHGSAADWSSTYGDGVAEWYAATGNVLTIGTSYVTIDGQVGAGESGHGFKISSIDTTTANKLVNVISTQSHLTFSHMELSCPGEDHEGLNQDGFYFAAAGSIDYINIDHCFIHDVTRNLITIAGSSHVDIGYCVLARRHTTNNDPHGQGIQIGSGVCTYIYVHDSIHYDQYATAFICPLDNTQEYIEVYGNVFYQTNASRYLTSNGTFGNTTGDTGNHWRFYNNTIIDGISECGLIANAGTDNLAYNNIWYNCETPITFLNFTHDYNASDVDLSETNDQLLSGDPFVSSPTDAHLSANTDAGTDLGASYDEDMDGVARTTWSRGAYEYVAGGGFNTRLMLIINGMVMFLGGLIGWPLFVRDLVRTVRGV